MRLLSFHPAPAMGTLSLSPSWEASAPLPLEEIYRVHGAQISHWAQHLGGPGVDVEDVTQEVFLVLAKRYPEFRGDAKLTTWLYQITSRVVMARVRYNWLRRFLSGTAEETAGEVPCDQPSVTGALELREQLQLLYRALDRLGGVHRRLLVLTFVEDMSAQQVAEITGMKVAAVYAELAKARRRLAGILDNLAEPK